eukprot:s182_g21.t2
MKRKAMSGQVADSSIELEVSLPSGRCETISLLRQGTIQDLKIAAQQSLGQRFLRLATAEGRLLDKTGFLGLSGLHDGDSLSAVALQPKIAATKHAFALWCDGGHGIVTWGDPPYGGDSSRVQHQLQNVQQVCATDHAFAAILTDGTVVTWGSPDDGGDCSRVQDQLKNVQQICATDSAFAAILADGRVVTWGDPDYGGDSSRVQDKLRDVQQICGTGEAFAAILTDGTVATWGNPNWGGDSSRVQDQLRNVQRICGTGGDFAATLVDGSVVTWGDPRNGGDSSRVQSQLKNVQQICATESAFVAILPNGTVVTWGNPRCGVDSSGVQDRLRNVKEICGTCRGFDPGAFAAILVDNTVVTWGSQDCSGDRVQHQLKNVQQVCATGHAFAAILADGGLVTWGNPGQGGDSSGVQDQFVLGCTQSAILQAVSIDVSVVAALPEDMRASVVMAEVSQANLDHLRRTPEAASTTAQAGDMGHLPKTDMNPKIAILRNNDNAAGSAEIDAVVLEALPPEIREEVLREEAARQREQQAAAASAEGRGAASNELDNASFIASLDPMLREEVLLSAPEEVLRTLPAELVAEAQLLRDRAFTRIALRRDVPPAVGRLPMGGPPAQECIARETRDYEIQRHFRCWSVKECRKICGVRFGLIAWAFQRQVQLHFGALAAPAASVDGGKGKRSSHGHWSFASGAVAGALAVHRGRRAAVKATTTVDPWTWSEENTYPKTWSNPSGAVLLQLQRDLWVAERPFVWNSIDVGGKMAVIRLADGSLWVHSPVNLDEPLRQALKELGPVKHIVSPNFEHVKWAKQWKEAFPDAILWGTPGMVEKFPEIPFDRELSTSSVCPPEWQDQLQMCFADCERSPAATVQGLAVVVFTTLVLSQQPGTLKFISENRFLMDKIYLPFYRRISAEISEAPAAFPVHWPPQLLRFHGAQQGITSAGSTAAAQEAVGTSDTEELPSSILDVIEADVARTFPNDKKFQESGGPESLRQVLIELAKQDKELGYCQSLNFIAANFLMVLSSQEMALAAVRQLILKLQTRQWYTDGMRQLRGDTAVLEEMVRERLPAVHQVLTLHRFDFLFVTSKWFLCLFAATLTDEVLRRVWDVLLVDGIEAVFRISLSLFALHQEAILQVKSEDGLIHMMQDWQPDCSPEVLIQNAYSPSLVGPIGRLELDQRRKRAAEAISSADARAEMRATQLRRGGVRPASVLSRQ